MSAPAQLQKGLKQRHLTMIAIGGVIGALAFFRADPLAPRRRYSYEDDEDSIASIDDELETPAPADVPVLWHRAEPRDERGVVLRFPPRPGD